MNKILAKVLFLLLLAGLFRFAPPGAIKTQIKDPQFQKKTRHISSKDYDIMIGLAPVPAKDVFIAALSVFVPIPSWMGVIDNAHRRFILLKRNDVYVLSHEILHAFIFSKDHGGGVMAAAQIEILPFMHAINRTLYLSPEDRKEVLRNKFRNFGEDIEQKIALESNEKQINPVFYGNINE